MSDIFFEQMQQEVKMQVKKEIEERKKDMEREERVRAILLPYAERGAGFAQVIHETGCPELLWNDYKSLLQEVKETRKTSPDPQPDQDEQDPFLTGFCTDLY